ncbi:MAG: iron ABC transporter permease [Acidobacteria bacterium]|nr:MAG: iron ABC transporter permease [Acidobacteriota bacterium]
MTAGVASSRRFGAVGASSGAALVAALLAWLVGYPLLITLLAAVQVDGSFSLSAVSEFGRRADEWMALWRSIWTSIASVVLAAAVGVPLAFLFERADFPGRRLLGALVALPVALPPLVGVIAFLFLYGESGFVARLLQAMGFGVRWRLQGAGAILLVHAYSMYVYFYLFTRAALARIDGAYHEAATALGCTPIRRLARVTLPLLRPALAGAALLTFMTALASFSAPYIFGGGFRVMTTQIVASKLNGDLALAHVETIALAALALAALVAMRWVDTAAPGGATGLRGAVLRRRRPSAAWRWLLAVVCTAAAGVLMLPHLTLLLLSFVPPDTWTTQALPPVLDLGNYTILFAEPERLRPLVNSLWMAGVATALAVALGLLAARFSLRAGGRLGRLLEGLVALPWAIPGTVFAIALAATFSVSRPWLGRFLWIGTPWILPLAYLVRSLPVTGRAALAGLRQLDPSLEEAAAALGAPPRRRLTAVVVPLLRPALVAGAALAFLTAAGDFVTSIVLYTYSTRPISIEVLSSLRLQQIGLAATYGVLLMALSAAVFLVWGRRDAV